MDQKLINKELDSDNKRKLSILIGKELVEFYLNLKTDRGDLCNQYAQKLSFGQLSSKKV